jgi:hypothetical protein
MRSVVHQKNRLSFAENQSTYRRHLWHAILWLIFLSGCAQPVHWQIDFSEEAGNAVLDTDGVKLVFEGIHIPLPERQAGNGASGSMQVAGSGMSVNILNTHDQRLTNSYSGGVNTITLGKYTLRVQDEGRKLQIGEKTILLGDGKRTIVIHEDGSAGEQK